MSRKFNEEETSKFVQLYREHKSLWDKRCDAYKCKEIRASALEQLRVGMNIEDLTIDEVKAKIKSIRNTYYLEIDKIEKSTRSGAAGRIYKPRAKWFDEYDSFIKPVSVRRKTIESRDRDQESASSEPAPKRPYAPESEAGSFYEVETNSYHKEDQAKQEALVNSTADDEECELFGRLLGCKLKSLEKRDRLMFMNKIDNYLHRKRMKMLGGGSCRSLSISDDEIEEPGTMTIKNETDPFQ